MADLGSRFPPDKFIQPLDQAVFLKERDKRPRAHHAELRMIPSNQCFSTCKNGRLSCHIKFRLVIDDKLLFSDGCGKVLNQLLV